MKKETLYVWIIAFLVLVNAVQLGAILLKPKPTAPPMHPPYADFKEKAIETLHLDEEQAKLFAKSAAKHRDEINKLNRKEKRMVAHYFQEPSSSGLEAIEAIQSEKIKVTQNHFEEIESMLNEQQLPDFETFKNEAIKRILR